ncbi:MFS transporter [Ectobacillus ponti]|uniref:MFS transporter n=1 Tax=Ectobacillus ponti TaxID=2961894 RepID=A0AA41XB99_9BACI|nr:MFS transporter [Ectobacillus ponti]MCP8969795.1 MFS transporter [Ectobacillus ponti]
MAERTQLEIQTAPLGALLRNTDFIALWVATLCSSFALAFFNFAQTWYIVKQLNLEASLGLVFLASSVPRLVFMILGGAMADRFPKRNIMFHTNIIRALLVAAILAWLLLGYVSLPVLTVFAFFFGLADAFFWSADGSIVPELVEKQQLTQANSITQMTNQSSVILGPVFAGIALKFGSYETVFALTIVFLLIAAVFNQRIRSLSAGAAEGSSMLTSIREGISYVRQSVFLSTLLICSAFLNFFLIGPMQVGFPLFIKNVLHGDSLHFSYLEGSVGGGMALGAVLVGILSLQRRRGLFCLVMLLLSGIAFFFLNFSTVLWQALAIGAVFGFTLAMAVIPLMAVIQATVKEEMMGRVMSLMMLSSMGLIPVSYAGVSLLLAAGAPIVLIMRAGAAAVIVFVLFVALRVPTVRTFD